MKQAPSQRTAVWAITPRGAGLARRIAGRINDSEVFIAAASAKGATDIRVFDRLAPSVADHFTRFSSHIFVMAAGIVVRSIADLLGHKTTDPAVVVCDEAGRFAVSLIAGHVGGANALAERVARITGGQAVITTATDVNRVPAIDLVAVQTGLAIENPQAIKTVNMALLTGDRIGVHDPYGTLDGRLPAHQVVHNRPEALDGCTAGVYVDHIRLDLPPHVLVLRPGSLVAGMGCNRGTALEALRGLLATTLTRHRLALASLRALATVDLKADEMGLVALAKSLGVPLVTFSRDQLRAVDAVPSPSAVVEHHIGVPSVCEAAALLATDRGPLIVPKQKTADVTLAVAADGYTSSASDRAHPRT